MYNLNNIDPEHKEALNNVNDLLKEFLEYQFRLKQQRRLLFKQSQDALCISSEVNISSEINSNANIIGCIQWIKYHLWGNTDEDIRKKTPGNISVALSGYFFNENCTITLYPFIQDKLQIDIPEGYLGFPLITFKCAIEKLIDLFIPNKTYSIFDIYNDSSKGSIVLQNEKERMLNKLNHVKSV